MSVSIEEVMRFQGHLWLHNEFKIMQGYMKFSPQTMFLVFFFKLKKQKNTRMDNCLKELGITLMVGFLTEGNSFWPTTEEWKPKKKINTVSLNS